MPRSRRRKGVAKGQRKKRPMFDLMPRRYYDPGVNPRPHNYAKDAKKAKRATPRRKQAR